MLRGPKALTPWVDLSGHQYTENVLLAGLGWAFTPESPFDRSTQKNASYLC